MKENDAFIHISTGFVQITCSSHGVQQINSERIERHDGDVDDVRPSEWTIDWKGVTGHGKYWEMKRIFSPRVRTRDNSLDIYSRVI